MITFKYTFLYCLIGFLSFSGCKQKKKSELVWDKNFYITGSQSSPRAVDLNGDGVLDIVMGAGKNEFEYSEQGIIAIDGKTGELIWQHEASDQVYGSATFYDITSDGVPDVLIGGRSPHFRAINGKTGEQIWNYDHQAYEGHPILRYARFNFHNSVLVPDQNGNGFPELLIVNGGNADAAPYSEEGRFPGVMMLFDTKTGEVVAADTMPDGKESYMSPICFRQPGDKDITIVFGTGGETISGTLYVASLSDLMNKNLSNANIIAREEGHGFIAPAVAADINKDGNYDIVAISHASSVFAIDGKTLQPIWKNKIDNTESSNAFAVGFFTDDKVPDFFTFVSKGEWPNNTGTLQVMFDGKNGTIAYLDSIGCTGFSSPVVYDLNDDGVDEAIISINEFDCNRGYANFAAFKIENKLISIDFKKKIVKPIDQTQDFKNIFSTPWIGDLDQDGYLDIVHCQYYSPSYDLLSFLGMRIKRIDTPVKIRKAPVWGEYMGAGGDGVFKQ